MQIKFSFDDNEIDADEPLGCVIISEGSESLHLETVWLDSVFEGLIQGFDSVLVNGVATVEIEEPVPIHMKVVGKGLRIEYETGSVHLTEIFEFRKCLRKTCSDLLQSLPTGHQNPMLQSLRDFINRDEAPI